MEYIKSLLEKYLSSIEEEKAYQARMINLINNYGKEALSRDLLHAHFTASVWLVNRNFSQVLLLKHAKLNKWLQPGGHADGDVNLLEVAKKELEEETGLKSVQLEREGIFDIDIHEIPEKNDAPTHEHFDIRFIMSTDTPEKVIINKESLKYKWINLKEIEAFTQNKSILRMAQKTLEL
jgi:8-oxo-dGTP pyrophosphatase MutT (NUDIX family)